MTVEKKKSAPIRRAPPRSKEDVHRVAWSRAEYGPRIGVCLPTLDKMLASGELGHLRVGTRVIITEKHEQDWIKNQTVKVSA